MNRLTITQVAAQLGLSIARVNQLTSPVRPDKMRLHIQRDALSGMRYVTGTELTRFAALSRLSGAAGHRKRTPVSRKINENSNCD